jgi:hypothetical protein
MMKFLRSHTLKILMIAGAAMGAASFDEKDRILDTRSLPSQNTSVVDELLGRSNRDDCVSTADTLLSMIRSAKPTIRKTITLCGNNKFYFYETADLSNKNIDLRCDSRKCVLDGSKLRRIFRGTKSVLSLKGIQVQNGFEGGGDGGHGGAFSFDNSTIKLINSNFVDNTATTGGAIFLKNSTLTLENVDFVSNTAVLTGAALYMTGSTLTATTGLSSFSENSSTHSAAIYLLSSRAKLKNVYFGENIASVSATTRRFYPI